LRPRSITSREQVHVVEADLRLKHRSDLTDAPRLLAVGDLHVENFRTWRDAEGRLVWGVNDFDEVAEMPYAGAARGSAIFAERENRLAIDATKIETCQSASISLISMTIGA